VRLQSKPLSMHVSSHHDPVDARTRRPCCLCVCLSLLRAVKELDTVVESCERLFSSPIPPNMARHCMRSLTLWLLALPVVLTQAMPPLLVGLWTAITSYIYLGVDELGAQVEQPFAIMPLWQLCHLAQLNVEESLSTPDLPLRLNRPSEMSADPLSCQSGIPFSG
jgi:predicted membrane chloride channel (bestrophin family)